MQNVKRVCSKGGNFVIFVKAAKRSLTTPRTAGEQTVLSAKASERTRLPFRKPYRRYFPVTLLPLDRISSTVPAATISPPWLPPPGPMSMT